MADVLKVKPPEKQGGKSTTQRRRQKNRA